MKGPKSAMDWDDVSQRGKLAGVGSRLGLGAADVAHLARSLEELNARALGPGAPRPRPMTRLPARLLRDVSAGGGLEVALRCIIERGKTEALASSSSSTQDAAAALGVLAVATEALRTAGLLRWPRLFFALGVPEEAKEELTTAARGLSADVARRAEDATHVVRWETKKPLLKNNPKEGNNSDDGKDGHPRTLLRTLEVDEARGVALVHWVYSPDSSDEWIDADRARVLLESHGGGDAVDARDWSKPLSPPARSNNTWTVTARFVSDALASNEWGCELDYEVTNDDKDKNKDKDGDVKMDAAAKVVKVSKESLQEETKAPSPRGRPSSANKGSAASGTTTTTTFSATTTTTKTNKRKRDNGRPAEDEDARLPPTRDDDREKSIRAQRDVVVATVEVADQRNGGRVSLSTTVVPKLEKPDEETGAAVVDEKEAVAAAAADDKEVVAAVADDEKEAESAETKTQTQTTTGATTTGTPRAGAGAGAPPNGKGEGGPPHPATSGATSVRPGAAPEGPTNLTTAQLRRNVFDAQGVTPLERACCPEWFCGDSAKTPDHYVEARNWMIAQSNSRPQTLLSATFCRQRLGVDACATIRLFNFVDAWGLVNSQVPAAARRVPKPRPKPPPFFTKERDYGKTWSRAQVRALVDAAAEYRDDWTAVAEQVNNAAQGVEKKATAFDAADCASRFVELALRDPFRGLPLDGEDDDHHHHQGGTTTTTTEGNGKGKGVGKRTTNGQRNGRRRETPADLDAGREALHAYVEARLTRVEHLLDRLARAD